MSDTVRLQADAGIAPHRRRKHPRVFLCTCEFWCHIPSLMSPTAPRFGPPSYMSLASSFDLSIFG
jgi:hypothetical protein